MWKDCELVKMKQDVTSIYCKEEVVSYMLDGRSSLEMFTKGVQEILLKTRNGTCN